MLSLLAVPLSTCETRTTRFGHIQSEDGSYSTFTERCWVLDPPDATTITLSFQRFDTEANYDVVRVYDGGDTSAPQLSPSRGFSGTAIPSQLTSTGGTMTVTFHSDYSITRTGFTFAWTSASATPLPGGDCAFECARSRLGDGTCDMACLNAACRWDDGDCTETCAAGCTEAERGDGTCDGACLNLACHNDDSDCACDTVLTAGSGYASDGSAPERDYATNLRKCWLIRPTHVRAGQTLALSFARFDLEQHYDTVKVFDGPTAASPALHTGQGFSGLHRGAALRSLAVNATGAQLLVTFVSDASITEAGFTFGWTLVPSGTAGACAENCTASMLTNNACDAACMNQACGWDGGGCDVGVECHPGCAISQLGDGTCDTSCLNAACNWDARDCECENVLEELSGYRDDGSGAGLDYGNDANDCWLIRPKLPAHNARAGPASPAGAVRSITLTFQRFDLEYNYDRLRLYAGHHDNASAALPTPNNAAGFTGTALPAPMTVHGVGGANAEILIRFTTDHSITESGFLFGWTTDVADAPLPAGACARGRLPDRSDSCVEAKIGDGVCNPQCMNAGCRWDGGDCLGTCGAPTAAGDQCYIEQLGNGECDPECMSADCNYDYRDCECDTVLDSRGGYASDGPPERDYSNGQRFCWLIRPKHPHVTKI